MVVMRSPAATTTYRLAAPQQAAAVPTLDEHQRRVLEHPGGPLLVLAGPGTGKTTTLVETIVHRIEQGARPEQVLALTFSRKAAEQLRDRVTARLGLTSAVAIGTTFHSFAYGLIRQHQPAELYEGPLQLLSAPEQDVVLQQLLTDAPESVRWPEGLRHAVGTRGFAGEDDSETSILNENLGWIKSKSNLDALENPYSLTKLTFVAGGTGFTSESYLSPN